MEKGSRPLYRDISIPSLSFEGPRGAEAMMLNSLHRVVFCISFHIMRRAQSCIVHVQSAPVPHMMDDSPVCDVCVLLTD